MKTSFGSPIRVVPKKDRRRNAAPVHGDDPGGVARVAFEFFLERGGEDGHDVQDWLRAERLLAAERPREVR